MGYEKKNEAIVARTPLAYISRSILDYLCGLISDPVKYFTFSTILIKRCEFEKVCQSPPYHVHRSWWMEEDPVSTVRLWRRIVSVQLMNSHSNLKHSLAVMVPALNYIQWIIDDLEILAMVKCHGHKSIASRKPLCSHQHWTGKTYNWTNATIFACVDRRIYNRSCESGLYIDR